MSSKIISINLVVYNGEKYLQHCLESVFEQTYDHELIELNIWDNASTDSTVSIVENLKPRINESKFKKFNFIKSTKNLGMWPAQEELLTYSTGEYVIVLSVDVILDKDFIKNGVETMERDQKIGALQARVYKYGMLVMNGEPRIEKTNTIDTLGFKIFRSRRIVNVGHGEKDNEQFNIKKEIFAVKGAVPFFRRQALDDCRLKTQGNKIIDHDYFWYGDDLDLPWRMRMFGWKQIYDPGVIAWHDRKTTKNLAEGKIKEFIKIRKTVPLFKRRLDWRNTTLTIIKNDFTENIFSDLPHILWRQIRLWGYFLLFEPIMILEIFKVARLLPRMLKRRREIMKKANISPEEFRRWIRS